MRYVSGLAKGLGVALLPLAIAGCSMLPFIGNGGPLPKGYRIIEDPSRIPVAETRKVERNFDGYTVSQEIGSQTFVFTRGGKACKLYFPDTIFIGTRNFPDTRFTDADCNGDVGSITANNTYGDDDHSKFKDLFKEADSRYQRALSEMGLLERK